MSDFKFAFSSMKQCDTFVTINDIGYCHKIKDESKLRIFLGIKIIGFKN